MFKSDVRADDYRAKASDELALADASPLDQVRLKHESAASVWLTLAAAEDRRTAHAFKQEARLQARDADLLAMTPGTLPWTA